MSHCPVEEVKQVARLARIHVTEEQATRFSSDLSSILGLMETLSQIDTDGVTPLTSPHESHQPLRADVVSEVNQREALMQNTEAKQDGLFLVPQVID
jgi:aspartyl-tRNA(Asn)/glutamyl-tRNA(Gln) amidotransferase subunit C